MFIQRQTLINRITHASIALSTFGLIFTGILQMPIAKRYNLIDLPGLSWAGDYWFTLQLHYWLGLLFTLACFWHITYHALRGEFDIVPRQGDWKASVVVIRAMISGKEEPPSDKYLPEQRLAWAGFAVAFTLIIVSGLVKTLKNIYGFDISNELYFACAMIHNAGLFLSIILVFGHLSAFIMKANRFLLPGMFSGRVDAEYVLHRHGLWLEGVEKACNALKENVTT